MLVHRMQQQNVHKVIRICEEKWKVKVGKLGEEFSRFSNVPARRNWKRFFDFCQQIFFLIYENNSNLLNALKHTQSICVFHLSLVNSGAKLNKKISRICARAQHKKKYFLLLFLLVGALHEGWIEWIFFFKNSYFSSRSVGPFCGVRMFSSFARVYQFHFFWLTL